MYKVYCLLISLFLSVIVIKANNNNKKIFKQLNVKDGLSHGSATCVLQDDEGFIWVGTYNGLNRFDAHEFKTFQFSENDSLSLSQNTVQCLHKDSMGNLWVGTYAGLNRYNKETERFERFIFNEPDPRSLNAVFSMCSDKKGTIWCGTWGSGVFTINPFNGSIQRIDFSLYPELSESSNLVRRVYCDSQGKIWICTWGDGILVYDPESKEIKKKFKGQIWDILEVSRGHFFVSTAFGGLFEFTLDDPKLRELDKRLTALLGQIDVARLKQDRNGNVWIATHGAGLFIYSPTNKTIEVQKYELKRESSISSNRVTDILFSSKQDMIWISTSDGLNVIDPHFKKFNLTNRKDFPDGVTSSSSRAFAVDWDGNLLIGTRNNGILAYNYKEKKFPENYCPYQYPIISGNNVLSLLRHDNKLLVATRHGFNTIEFKTSHIEQTKANYTVSYGQLSNNYVRDIFFSSKGELWLGTDAGLEYSEEGNAHFTLYQPYKTDKPEALENLVWTVTGDKEGNIWIGTDGGGLCRFDSEQKQFVDYFRHDTKIEGSLSDNRVISQLIDSKQRLWVGTAGGLNLLNSDGSTFRSLTREKNGLRSDVIFALEEDNNGFIWFSTANTLVKFNPETWQFIEFNHVDGIQDKEFYKEASTKLPDGSLVFGGLGGFNFFHPDSLYFNAYKPPVVLTGLTVFNRAAEQYKRTDDEPLLSKSVHYTDTLYLSYKENSFTFKFSALNYSFASKNRFKYMLQNFDKDWVDNGFGHTAAYSNMTPGTYIFKVKAANNDGVWNPDAKMICIIIQPPYYQTIWFKILVGFMFVFILIGAYMRRRYIWKEQTLKLEKQVDMRTNELQMVNIMLEERQEEIESQNEEILAQKEDLYAHRNHLERLVEERTADLITAKLKAEESDRLKSAFLANISHEIRTPMNAIIGFSSLLESGIVEPEDRSYYLKVITENCNILLRLIDDILDLSKIEAGVVEVSSEWFSPVQLLNSLTVQYKTTLTKKGLDIFVVDTLVNAKWKIYSDKLRIQQVLCNLIDNAIKFTDEGHITLGLSKITKDGSNYCLFYVCDTGIGIVKEQQGNIFNSFTKLTMGRERLYEGTGLGLSICKEIVKLLGGEIWVESVLGNFSKFYFTIKYDSAE